MYYLKTKEFKNLVISYGRDDDDPMYFRMFKHKGSPFFKRFSQRGELCEGKCGMSYCNENGCLDKKEVLVEPKDASIVA